ncbi:hypothetical protein LG276_20335 [Cytobacillus kochii]|uniref:TIGR03826 family flagellar region protein n=1 Tax=Cytobacillus kochii TaxID=859143 RepID=UPI00384F2271
MAEIANCPRCNALFMKNQVSTICQACFKKEEEAYEVVYAFLRKRENRAATMQRITEATGVEEWLLQKFVRSGRLKVAQFPQIGYPCDQCGTLIQEGRICESCRKALQKELEQFEREQDRIKERERTYYSYRGKQS